MKIVLKFLLIAISVIILDQLIKSIFVQGFSWDSKCISLVLTYNKGVAFSMFAFLGEYLKYIQIFLFSIIVIYLLNNKNIFLKFYIPLSLVFGGGISNIIDRFYYDGVVDYVYWHCWFDFAIFNLADVIIDLSIILFLIIEYKNKH